MTEHIVIGIVSVIVLGISAQWLAWHFKMPSILLLLIFGFLAGPVTGLLPPASLQGEWLHAFVSLSIGIILFEGGLNLRLSEFREVGKAVVNLITIGVLVTWLLATLGAYYLVGFNFSLSVLVGAILTVTGPTVVMPLLRHVRPTGRVGAIAKWEGITIDPVGAILAVLVLETILLLNQAGDAGSVGEAVLHAAQGLLLTIFISVGVSVLGAAALIVLLRRRLVPDYLQSAVALMMVVGTFALSNVLQEESGLLEVTLMGIIMANQRYVPVRRIMEFKEDLQVLLIACLFILLSARLELDALDYLDGRALLFLAALIFLVRPLAVMLSALGTRLNGREQAFLAWLAPRGIVAAAVASLFAFRLRNLYPEEVGGLVPIVFLVIVGTVAVYGLTISPLARYLGLAHPNPQGVLLLGAHPWAQQIGQALQALGFKVLLIDSNTKNVAQSRRNDLPAEAANALSESIIDELDLGGLGRFLALTPNDEVNSLAALHFSEVFETNEVYQLAARPESRKHRAGELPQHLRGRPLFGKNTTFASLTERFNRGGEVRTVELTDEHTLQALQEHYDGEAVLLFIVRGNELLVHAEEGEITPQPGDAVIIFTPPAPAEPAGIDRAPFERLVAQASFLDLEKADSFEIIVRRAAEVTAAHLPITADRLGKGFLEAVRYGAMPVSHGVALPHYRLPHIEEPEMVMVRCRNGIRIPFKDEAGKQSVSSEPVYAIFFLISPEDKPGQHLQTLANLARRIDEETFLDRWRAAGDEQQIKATLLHEDRHVALTLSQKGPTADFVGLVVANLDLPPATVVGLVRRDGKLFVPNGDTVLREGDQITITGDTSGIRYLRDRYRQGMAEEPAWN